MHRKSSSFILLIFLALAIIFPLSSCEKLRASRLKANYHFTRANKFFTDGQFRNAIEQYEIALNYNPQLIEAYRYLGESYKNFYRIGVDTPENMEKANKAVEALTKALEIDPKNKQVLYSLADMYDRLKNFEEAEKLYLKIADLDPANLNNYNVLADFYKGHSLEREDLKVKAEQMYFRRIELAPESSDSYAFVAQFYNERIKYEPEIASQLFDMAHKFQVLRTKLVPDDYVPWFAIGANRFYKAHRLQNYLTYDEKEKIGNVAKEALLKAIELEPDAPNPYIYMHMLYINIFSKIYPEREDIMHDEANRWREKYEDKIKKERERQRLEQELRGRR